MKPFLIVKFFLFCNKKLNVAICLKDKRPKDLKSERTSLHRSGKKLAACNVGLILSYLPSSLSSLYVHERTKQTKDEANFAKYFKYTFLIKI